MSILSFSKVRSYCGPEPVTFDLSEPVTMIYGQNGSGKSTISRFFYRPNHHDYRQCSLSPPLDMRTLVFSQEYVVDLFSNAFQPGIFSLSEENATVRASIEQLEAESDKIKDKINWIKTDKDKNERIAKQVREKCAERIRGSVAEIRTTELWDLMAGAKQGDRLYHAIIGHPDVLTTTTTNLISELQALKLSQGNHLAVIPTLSIPSINSQEIELLNQMLIPSENSTLSAAIARLGNIDWVASGQVWLIKDECPFCQSKIDADHLRREISALFERSWKDSIMQLENLAQRISKWLDVAKKWSSEAMLCPLVTPECPLICVLNDLMKGWSNNLKLILKKSLHLPNLFI